MPPRTVITVCRNGNFYGAGTGFAATGSGDSSSFAVGCACEDLYGACIVNADFIAAAFNAPCHGLIAFGVGRADNGGEVYTPAGARVTADGRTETLSTVIYRLPSSTVTLKDVDTVPEADVNLYSPWTVSCGTEIVTSISSLLQVICDSLDESYPLG